MGSNIGNNKLYALHFAEDQVILAKDEDDINYIVSKLAEEYNT